MLNIPELFRHVSFPLQSSIKMEHDMSLKDEQRRKKPPREMWTDAGWWARLGLAGAQGQGPVFIV